MTDDRRTNRRDADRLYADWRKDFWAQKARDTAPDTDGPAYGAGWYRVAYLGNPVGTW